MPDLYYSDIRIISAIDISTNNKNLRINRNLLRNIKVTLQIITSITYIGYEDTTDAYDYLTQLINSDFEFNNVFLFNLHNSGTFNDIYGVTGVHSDMSYETIHSAPPSESPTNIIQDTPFMSQYLLYIVIIVAILFLVLSYYVVKKDKSHNTIYLCDEGELSENIISWDDITPFFVNNDKLDILGKGSYGIVFKAKFKNDIVAIKLLRIPGMEFNKEARLILKLNKSLRVDKRHIVHLYGILRGPINNNNNLNIALNTELRILPNNEVYEAIVLRFEKGGSLEEDKNKIIIANKSPCEKLHLLRGIANALTSLHDHRPNYTVHGDLKPDNILFSDSNLEIPVLANFGIANEKINPGRTTGGSTRHSSAGTIDDAKQKGTWRYMAPEMLADHRKQIRAVEA
jgi:hypothetical protein